MSEDVNGEAIEATPYLIAHRVRGQPAFDVAQKMQVGSETWWIIPTSGHRAYPYWYIELNDLSIMIPEKYGEKYYNISECIDPMPPDLPDHYAVIEQLSRPSRASRARPTIDDLL